MNSDGSYALVLPWSPTQQGGVTRVVEELEKGIAARGGLTPLIAVDTWDALVPREIGSAWHLRWSLIGKHSPLGVLKALAMLPKVLWRLDRWLRRFDVRVVNFHFAGLSALGVLALKRMGLYRGRVILSFHGTDVRPAETRIERLLWPIVHRWSDAIVACSSSLADRLAATSGLVRSHIHVIYNGVDGSVYRPDAPEPDGMPPLPESYIASVGAFIPRKDHATLVHAFGMIAESHPSLALVLAGADGPERASLGQQIATLGLASRTLSLSGLNREQVAFLLARCRVCVQPALSESFPLAVLEAGAAGTVVIASRIAGHDELIEDGISGLMFTARDPAACAGAIERALGDARFAESLARTLRQRVLSQYTWSNCAEAYLRVASES